MAPAVDETMLMRILVVLRSAGVLVVTLPGGSPLNCCQESIVHDENPSFWVSVGSDIVTVGDLASFWYFLVVNEQHMVLVPLMRWVSDFQGLRGGTQTSLGSIDRLETERRPVMSLERIEE